MEREIRKTKGRCGVAECVVLELVYPYSKPQAIYIRQLNHNT
ncbi:MAG: hypothetical protein AAF632_07765 [Bacteroidota bacterium]